MIRRTVLRCLFLALSIISAISCIKDQEYEEVEAIDSNIDLNDTLLVAKDASVPLVYKIDADGDGSNECALALYLRKDSTAYTILRPYSGSAISIDTKISEQTSTYYFAKNYSSGDTIRKTDVFRTDSVFLAYRNVADTILGSVAFNQIVGNKCVVVFRKTTYSSISYWWLELEMVDYSQIKLTRHSIPVSLELR